MADTVQLSDEYLLQSSLQSDHTTRVSRSKNVVYLPDINQGSYNSSLITIDGSSQLNGSKGFASLKEAYLTVPFIITAKNVGPNSFTSRLDRFACSLKSGVWNIISDLEVELGGKSVLTSNEYKNHWNNLRAMTETSVSDAVKHGSDRHLYNDDWYSINFTAAAHPNGDGYSNNSSDILLGYDNTLGQTQENKSCNSGMVARLNNALPVLDSTTNPSFGWPSLSKSGITNITSQHGRGCFLEKAAAASTAIAGTWIYILKIKLVDLHPLFKELNLIANPQIKIRYRVSSGTAIINLDKTITGGRITSSISGSTTVTNDTLADFLINNVDAITLKSTSTVMSLDSLTMKSGNICPIIVSSGADTQPLSDICGATTTGDKIGFSWGALMNSYTNTSDIGTYLPYTTTRLQIPFYDLVDPRQIIEKPIKTVKYLDCFSVYFKNQSGVGVSTSQLNSDFSLVVPGNKKNIKYVAVIPYANTSSDYWTNALTTEQFQSPFDTAPWTFMPGASIRNFQVQIGSQNVFSKTHTYDYETYLDEFCKLASINGDNSRDMNTGLIDYNQWVYCQRAMVADCSRISEKDVPQAVQISGTNSSCQGMNLLVFVVYERELQYDRITGEVLHSSE